MGGRYYTRATKLAGLVEIAAERGADIGVLMREAGLNPAVLRSPETAIDYGGFCELLRRCAVAWDLPDIGLRMTRYQQIDFLGPVALVTRMERTVRGALRAIIANLVIHANATVAALEEETEGGTAALILNQRDDAPKCRENTELVMAQGKLVIASIAGAPVPLVEAAFVHDKGSSSRAVEVHFACPIRYGTERNALTFDRALLDRRIEKSDLAYHALIRKYLATARAELGGGLSEDVRAEIARQMELGCCTLESVADSLRMPPRSLQRRLQAEGLCFRNLLDEWRRSRALSLVTNTRLPLSEVSEALGYSEQSVFTEAFRRWYGGTPHRFRMQRPAAGA
ncbi:MAG: AraC family transcriptional regulator [Acetobacteraceae bacterium]|nr:AraC family transcriptional regulator [Acetobacteraceae bacterium]